MTLNKCYTVISIHTSTREVTVVAHWQKCYTIFQSTLPQGKWLCICHSFILAIYFNPHFCKGSDGSRLWKAFQTWFQSTLPQGKWRAMLGGGCKDMDISIHTSAREVTGGKVFIKRPLRNFNPHFRKGSDEMSVLITYLSYISIHTSAREVTDTAFIPINLLPNFNPHFRKGSDGNLILHLPIHFYFNPHFRKGSDLDFFQDSFCLWISIHTSAREVTWGDTGKTAHQKSFQSTLPQGKWLPSVLFLVQRQYFNPHFRKGSDICCIAFGQTYTYFNPHFRKGSDGTPSDPEPTVWQFQSTLPQGKWLFSSIIGLPSSLFQSTLPQGKWLITRADTYVNKKFQSTLPQGKWRY